MTSSQHRSKPRIILKPSAAAGCVVLERLGWVSPGPALPCLPTPVVCEHRISQPGLSYVGAF